MQKANNECERSILTIYSDMEKFRLDIYSTLLLPLIGSGDGIVFLCKLKDINFGKDM